MRRDGIKVASEARHPFANAGLIEARDLVSVKSERNADEMDRVLSSAGRASPLQGEGRRFEPCSTHQSMRRDGIETASEARQPLADAGLIEERELG
jgi:hypothetical protein